jgi:hypothetical protein
MAEADVGPLVSEGLDPVQLVKVAADPNTAVGMRPAFGAAELVGTNDLDRVPGGGNLGDQRIPQANGAFTSEKLSRYRLGDRVAIGLADVKDRCRGETAQPPECGDFALGSGLFARDLDCYPALDGGEDPYAVLSFADLPIHGLPRPVSSYLGCLGPLHEDR